MSVETEIIKIREKYKQALRDFTVINNDNKALLLMIFVLMEGMEHYCDLDNPEIAKVAIADFQLLWAESGRQGTCRTGVQDAS